MKRLSIADIKASEILSKEEKKKLLGGGEFIVLDPPYQDKDTRGDGLLPNCDPPLCVGRVNQDVQPCYCV